MMFELFYWNGGHCGPFHGIDEAIKGAEARLPFNNDSAYIDIRPYPFCREIPDRTMGYRVRIKTLELTRRLMENELAPAEAWAKSG